MNTYFDLHFHPLFKQYLVEFDDQKRKQNAWESPINLPKLGKAADKLVGRILESQCCVSDSLNGGLVLGVANIVALEHAMGNRSLLFRLLELNEVTPLDERYFQFVRESQGSYNDLMNKELEYYLWAEEQTPDRINLISRKKGVSLANQLQEGKLNIMLALEGGHNLSQRKINELVGIQDPVKVVTELRQSTQVDFLYLTLTHLTHIREQPLCSHAYGFKLVNLPEVKPQITGLTELGREVIKACMDSSGGQDYPILIDVKHMSLAGRLEYYTYRKQLLSNDTFKTSEKGWPIMATHMGVTGFGVTSLNTRMVEAGLEGLSVRLRTRREKAGNIGQGEGVYFNSWTINLLNEDIQEIAMSGGLIGISLDARILGFEGLAQRLRNRLLEDFSFDYMSPGDFSRFFPEKARQLSIVAPMPQEAFLPDVTESIGEEELFGLANRKERELYLFCLNVLHIVAVINELGSVTSKELSSRGMDANPLNGWDFVTIGSDFDGLIDSVDGCRTISNLSDFEEKLVNFFPKAEKAYLSTRTNSRDLLPYINGSFDAVHFRKHQLRKLLFENGKRFMEWWLSS